MTNNRIYWITGLSGSGKTTLCRKLVNYLREQNRQIVMLDGDQLRAVMCATGAHSREERLNLAMRYAQLCRIIVTQGVDVAIATISLFHEVHAWNRVNLPGYLEIFIDVPLAELVRRDPKNIYERVKKGKLKNVAGVDIAVDYPVNPDVLLAWRDGVSVDNAFDELLGQLHALAWSKIQEDK